MLVLAALRPWIYHSGINLTLATISRCVFMYKEHVFILSVFSMTSLSHYDVTLSMFNLTSLKQVPGCTNASSALILAR